MSTIKFVYKDCTLCVQFVYNYYKNLSIKNMKLKKDAREIIDAFIRYRIYFD